MRKMILKNMLPAACLAILLSCQKSTTEPPAPDTRFPLPLITKDSSADLAISGKETDNFLGKYVVGLYYGTEVMPQKVDVVVIRNGNKSNVKTLETGVTTFPSTFEVTGPELSDLFDTVIVLGDKFEIGLDVTTKDGQKFLAFPTTGNPYGADTATLPGSRFTISYLTECTFNIADFDGYYKVLANTWDYEAGDSVLVKPGIGNTIMITAWPNPEFGIFTRIPMRVEVDPVTFVATVPLQVVGEFAGGMFHTIDEGSGTVSPCADKISLTLMFMLDSYYGEQKLMLGR